MAAVSSAPSWRNLYVLTNSVPAGGGEAVATPVAVRVRTGITDGSSTEVMEGLKEGDVVVTGVKMPVTQEASSSGSSRSPFGGPRFR